MNIILAALNRNTIYTPLALMYLRACIEQDKRLARRVSVDLKEFELDDSTEFILLELVKSDPSVVAFSCYIWNIKFVLRLSRLVKKVLPRAKIVLGGPEVSPRAEEVLAGEPSVDFIVRGEGEFVFKRLIGILAEGGDDFGGVEGISYRKGKRIISTRDQSVILRLDAIPSVYLGGSTELANREVCLETQRGCVYNCAFCYYNKGCASWRKFSLARVKRELACLLSNRDLTIYLMDPVFNLDRVRAKDICRFIISRNRHKIPFHTELQAELVDGELAALLKKAGMRYVEVGLQSTDERVLSGVNRRFDRARFVRGVNFLKGQGLVVELQLILGLPGETLESFERSLDFALELDPAVLAVFKLQVLPGTRIRRQALESGIEYDPEPPYEFIQSPAMSFRDAATAQKMVNSVSLFRRNPAAVRYCRRNGIRMTSLIRRWLDYMPSDGILLNGEDNRFLEREAVSFVRSLKQ